jgi:hypothetical protein
MHHCAGTSWLNAGDPVLDPVDKAAHYNQGDVECIDALKACSSTEEYEGFCKLTAMSYLWREKHKGGLQDLKKAKWYLEKLIESRGEK